MWGNSVPFTIRARSLTRLLSRSRSAGLAKRIIILDVFITLPYLSVSRINRNISYVPESSNRELELRIEYKTDGSGSFLVSSFELWLLTNVWLSITLWAPGSGYRILRKLSIKNNYWKQSSAVCNATFWSWRSSSAQPSRSIETEPEKKFMLLNLEHKFF